MYRKLTDREVKNLTRKIESGVEFVVSHVGDGEYSCNVFGNIYSSYWQALKKAREKESDLIMYEEIRDLPSGKYTEYYIGQFHESWANPSRDALLTLERINQDFDMGQ
jgi:hypothetical protein